jgi:hypothetical protein
MRKAPFHATPRHMAPHHRPLISVLSHPYPPLGLRSPTPAHASLYQLITLARVDLSARGFCARSPAAAAFLGSLLPLPRPPHPKRVLLSPGTTSGVSACSMSLFFEPGALLVLHLLITSIRQLAQRCTISSAPRVDRAADSTAMMSSSCQG